MFYKVSSTGEILNDTTTDDTGVPVYIWKG